MSKTNRTSHRPSQSLAHSTTKDESPTFQRGILTAVNMPPWENRMSDAKPKRKLDQED